MKIAPRSLPLAEELIKSTGLEMTYPYEDLVFVEHNPFLLRFNDETPSQIFIHFNKDCLAEDKDSLMRTIESKALSLNAVIVEKSNYYMNQLEGVEEIRLEFLE